MNRLAKFASRLGLFSPKPLSPDTPEQFTQSFADALKAADSSITFEIVRPLELKLKGRSGSNSTSFLYNAYDLYKQNPSDKSGVIKKYLIVALETVTPKTDSELDLTRIVPIIKDTPWMEESRQAIVERGEKPAENVFDEFAEGLVIIYAEDSPKSIRYITPGDLEKSGLDKSALRKVAGENLRRIVPKFEIHGGNGIYMVVAGGDYEASFLAYEPLWQSGQFVVEGDPVIAIPARDLLMVTGSNDLVGIEKLRTVVAKVFGNASYRLTNDLYVYRQGEFRKFSQP